jgi:hypothetical protein
MEWFHLMPNRDVRRALLNRAVKNTMPGISLLADSLSRKVFFRRARIKTFLLTVVQKNQRR